MSRMVNACRSVNWEYLKDFVTSYEEAFDKKIRCLIMSPATFNEGTDYFENYLLYGFPVAIDPCIGYGQVELIFDEEKL